MNSNSPKPCPCITPANEPANLDTVMDRLVLPAVRALKAAFNSLVELGRGDNQSGPLEQFSPALTPEVTGRRRE